MSGCCMGWSASYCASHECPSNPKPQEKEVSDNLSSDDVKKLRRGAPLLTDIPGQLRAMADKIEAGEEVGHSAIFILLNEDAEKEDWPQIFGWGEALGDYQMIGMLEIAKTFFVVNKTARFA